MGITTPEQVTTLHWTRFPAAALPIDWTDHKAAHRAVMSLFARDMPGDPGRRRSVNGILYRLDALGDQVVTFVQSTIAPVLLPADAQTLPVPDSAWRFEPGVRVGFRVAVNPVRRIGKVDPRLTLEKKASSDLVASGKAREVGIGFSDVPAWLASKLAPGLSEVEVLDHFRDVSTSGRHRLTVDTFECLGTVTEPAAFEKMRIAGVGRAKTYGCGLLTARRAIDA